MYYPPQGQQQPMPYAPMAQQPVLYMPVTGPNGEQGFAPVVVPPGSQFPASGHMPAGVHMPASGAFPPGSAAMYQPPYAPSAAAQLVNGQQSAGQPATGGGPGTFPPTANAASPAQHNGSNNPFAPAANGSAPAPAHDSEVDGGVTDSESEVRACFHFSCVCHQITCDHGLWKPSNATCCRKLAVTSFGQQQ